jgi:hypothetical protein
MFHVGQKVVCVNGADSPFGETTPVVGDVYTIRSVTQHSRGPGYRLHEIVNVPRTYLPGHMECTFAHACFRPVIEKKTDISVFTQILDKVNKRETVKCP